jgi:hypothetical protein
MPNVQVIYSQALSLAKRNQKWRKLMKLFPFFYPKVPTVKDALLSLIRLPQTFSQIFKDHIFNLLPLVLTQLLQRFQDVVDNRYLASLGNEALAIHNVQFNLYFIAQEIGLAAAISALIFWRRKENRGKQGSILKLHILLPILLTTGLAGVIYFFLDGLQRHFHILEAFRTTAHLYWTVGLANLVFRSIQFPLCAILIACDQRLRCVLLGSGVLLAKIALNWSALHFYWDSGNDPVSILKPMMLMDLGSIVILAIGAFVAYRWISGAVDGWNKMDFKSILKVWPGELGIAAINSIAGVTFGFQVAEVLTSPGFFVTYELALNFTYILALPVIAGMQIAVRDASAEQSNQEGSSFIPLHESKWWPQFFYASLMPTCTFFAITAFFAKPIFQFVYNYTIPKEHLIFMPVFFASWIIWEVGDVYLIMMRAAKKNTLATRNFLIATLGTEVGLTQLLLWKGWATPLTLSGVSLLFCLTYFILNRQAIAAIQWKFFLVKEMTEAVFIRRLSNFQVNLRRLGNASSKYLPRATRARERNKKPTPNSNYHI